MIGYVTLGTNDIERARAFYDALLSLLGAKRLVQMDEYGGFTMYGVGMTEPSVAITRPYNAGEAHSGNGLMTALVCLDRDKVAEVHAKALELGGSDEGAPGLRGDAAMGFYAGYFRDPDGNKLAIFCMERGS